jgi:uncharacterized repeat protein (TIGR02543 family)
LERGEMRMRGMMGVVVVLAVVGGWGCEDLNQSQNIDGAQERTGAPAAEPPGGEVASGTEVRLSSATEGAAIYYTLDGTEPVRGSRRYDAPVPVSGAVTIKALAVKEGMLDSGVLEAAYTLKEAADNGKQEEVPGPAPPPNEEEEEPAGYTVTFHKNGGSREASPRKLTVSEGGMVEALPEPPGRDGYVLKGWNTAKDGSGTAFTAGTAPSGNLTVYAQWELDLGPYGSIAGMAAALSARPANTPVTPYEVSLTSPVSLADIRNGDPALGGLLSGVSGRYVAVDLRDISSSGGTVIVDYVPDNNNQGQDYLVSILLPSWLTEISGHAFKNLTQLRSVNLEDTSVTYIGYYTFAHTGLVSITMPATLTELGHCTFLNNTSLVSVDMSRTTLQAGDIPGDCFEGCSALTEIGWGSSKEQVTGEGERSEE